MVVAGDPPSERVMTQVRELGLQEWQVVFPGLVADVRGILSACDVVFVLSYSKASSYACCEAMAMGLPALVSDAGGLPENLRDGIDGWVVPVGNVEALAQRLRAVLDESPVALAAKGAFARARVETLFLSALFWSVQSTRTVPLVLVSGASIHILPSRLQCSILDLVPYREPFGLWKNFKSRYRETGAQGMNRDHYTYRVTWSAEDSEHVGLCVEFPSLSWLASTPEDALAGILSWFRRRCKSFRMGRNLCRSLADRT